MMAMVLVLSYLFLLESMMVFLLLLLAFILSPDHIKWAVTTGKSFLVFTEQKAGNYDDTRDGEKNKNNIQCLASNCCLLIAI